MCVGILRGTGKALLSHALLAATRRRARQYRVHSCLAMNQDKELQKKHFSELSQGSLTRGQGCKIVCRR